MRARGISRWAAGLQALLLLAMLLLPALATAATIQTDLWVYQDGDTVTITGVEYGASEVVDFVTTDPEGTVVDAGSAITDDAGSVTYQFVLHVTVGGIYDVIGAGKTSGLTATTQFDPPNPSVSPTSWTFGGITIGTSSGAKLFTISNGTGPLSPATSMNVTSVSSSNPEFVVGAVSTPINGIAPGESTTFTVTFTPSAAGVRTGSISIQTNGADPTIPVSGTGVSPDSTAPSVTIDSVSDSLLNASELSTNLTWHADENGTYNVRIGGSTCATGASVASGGYSTSPATVVTNVLASSLAEGANTIRVCVTDAATNTGSATTTVTKDTVAPNTAIDSAPGDPSGTGTPTFTFISPDGGIVFECQLDGGSFATCSSPYTTASLPDGGHTFSVRSVDAAGNTDASPASHAWTVDSTAPSVTIDSVSDSLLNASELSTNLTWHADENGTYNVRIGGSTCATGASVASGGYSTSPATVVTNVLASSLAEGANTIRVCVTDAATNTGSATTTVTKDTVAPAVTVTPDRPADQAGWYNHAVTFDTQGSDTTSGVVDGDCTADQPYPGPDGTGLTVDGTCTDAAGNVGHGTSAAFDFDDTDPTTSLAVTAGTSGAAGWFIDDVTVSTSGADALSGLVSCTADQFQTTDTTGTTFTGSCTDLAGNTGSAAPLTVMRDARAPSVTVIPDRPADQAGWYNHAVTFDTQGSDTTSGVVDGDCTADQPYPGPDGTGLTVDGTCADAAGNVGHGTSAAFDFDDTDPTLTWIGSISDGASYVFGSVPPVPTCDASDGLSGASGCSVTGYGANVGSHTLVATSHDIAGNAHAESRTYTVLAWALGGFYQPVDMGAVNIVKGGSTVPLKFEVFAGSTELTSVNAVKGFKATSVDCVAFVDMAADAIEITSTGGTSLRFDSTSGQFIQNWQTPRSPGACYSVAMTTQDGSTLFAHFKLK